MRPTAAIGESEFHYRSAACQSRLWTMRRLASALSYTSEPRKSARLPISARICIGYLDRRNPLRVLVAQLRRPAQPERIAERIGNRFVGVFRRKQRLRMQRSCHINAAWIVVSRLEGDVLRPQVCTDMLQECAQGYSGPPTNITPTFDTHMLDDSRAQRKSVKLCYRLWTFVGNKPRHFQMPRTAIYGFDVHDVIVGIEFRGFKYHGSRIRLCQLVWPKDQCLYTVVHSRDREQGGLDRLWPAHVAPCKQCKRTKRQDTPDQPAPFEGSDQQTMVIEDSRVRTLIWSKWRFHGRTIGSPRLVRPTRGPSVSIAQNVSGTSRARRTCTTRKPTMTTMPRKWMIPAD